MTKKELMQVYYLNREIMNDTEELVELKIKARENLTENGETPEYIRKREREIIEKIRRCSEAKDRANRFIDSIEDSLTRQIFHYRFVKNMTWKKVAFMTGGYNSEEGVRKIAERYLKACGEKDKGDDDAR